MTVLSPMTLFRLHNEITRNYAGMDVLSDTFYLFARFQLR